MDPQPQGVLVSSLRFLYASLGFALSVLAALLVSVYPRSRLQAPPPAAPAARPRLPRSAKGRRPLRIVSAESVLSTRKPSREQLASVIPEETSRSPGTPNSPLTPSPSPRHASYPPLDTSNKRHAATHRRSQSIPIITVDFFGSLDHPRGPSTRSSLPDTSARTILPTLRSEPDTISDPDSIPGDSGSHTPPKPASLLAQFKQSLTKDKTRTMQRVRSTPQFCAVALITSAMTTNTPASPVSPPIPSPKDKCRQALRKATSIAAFKEGSAAVKGESVASRKVENKRSGPLRTHPYEAPYFCQPPTIIERPTTPTQRVSKKHSKPRIIVPS